MLSYLRRNKILLVGLFLIGFLAVFTIAGYLFSDVVMQFNAAPLHGMWWWFLPRSS